MNFVREISKITEVLKKENLNGCCIATISTDPKVYSNGIEVKTLASVEETSKLLIDLLKQMSEFLVLGAPTVSIVNGFATAAGLYNALLHDYVICKSGKYILSLPEQ